MEKGGGHLSVPAAPDRRSIPASGDAARWNWTIVTTSLDHLAPIDAGARRCRDLRRLGLDPRRQTLADTVLRLERDRVRLEDVVARRSRDGTLLPRQADALACAGTRLVRARAALAAFDQGKPGHDVSGQGAADKESAGIGR